MVAKTFQENCLNTCDNDRPTILPRVIVRFIGLHGFLLPFYFSTHLFMLEGRSDKVFDSVSDTRKQVYSLKSLWTHIIEVK